MKGKEKERKEEEADWTWSGLSTREARIARERLARAKGNLIV